MGNYSKWLPTAAGRQDRGDPAGPVDGGVPRAPGKYPESTFPSAAVYDDIASAGLRLITCGGLDYVSRKFEANLVVFATLIGHTIG